MKTSIKTQKESRKKGNWLKMEELLEELEHEQTGKDIASTGKNILSNLLDPEVARQYNWTGAKGKKDFQSYIILRKSPLINASNNIYSSIKEGFVSV